MIQRLRPTLCAAFGLALVSCGGEPQSPTAPKQPVVAAPTPATTPTPSSAVVLPSGMVCDPTPPPLLRLNIKIHARDGNRTILDSKPVVTNVDGYCDRVGFGDWKFCDTRPEGHPQRAACDYLATGKAENGRWGPTWFLGMDNCGAKPEECADHPNEQFMTIAKKKGTYEACANEHVPVASNGARCSFFEFK
jgi:hypothetical protein